MKLITLNTWGGRAGRKIVLDFFKQHQDVDVFCLQEIWSAPYENYEGHEAGGRTLNHEEVLTRGRQEIEQVLKEHQSFFCPLVLNDYGIEMLMKKDLTVLEDGEVFVYKHRAYIAEEDMGDHGRPIQYTTQSISGSLLTVINFHGAWIKGKNKIDTEDRIEQSKKIVEFIKSLPNEFILAGDFNLLPDTESLAILERAGLRNLIKEYGITSTRTPLYDGYETLTRYADYIFVSSGIKVRDFKVLPDIVSDHSPLYLDFVLE